jgi:multiple sugar transport system substrate-binding protein
MLPVRAVVLVSLLILPAPLGAQAADLVVWWEKGYYDQEDEAVAEIIEAFEKDTGKQVELLFYSNEELPGALEAALEAGQPPDFAFGFRVFNHLS